MYTKPVCQHPPSSTPFQLTKNAFSNAAPDSSLLVVLGNSIIQLGFLAQFRSQMCFRALVHSRQALGPSGLVSLSSPRLPSQMLPKVLPSWWFCGTVSFSLGFWLCPDLRCAFVLLCTVGKLSDLLLWFSRPWLGDLQRLVERT